MKFQKGRTRRGVAGIIATVIMFAILFTVGTSYFIFVDQQNASYVSSLLQATSKVQSGIHESLSIASALESDGDVGFTATDTSSVSVNMTSVLVISSTGALLKCAGVGFPSGAGCSNTTPSLWMEVTAGSTSSSIDTGYTYTTGTTDTIKVLTARGNTYSTTYPSPASQSTSSQSVTVNLDNLKWVQLLPQASSLYQKKYVSNCNAAACAVAYGSNVVASDILVAGVSWANSAPPSTVPSDTLHDVFTLGSSASLTTYTTPALVQSKSTANCNAASCGLAFTNNVASGDTLVYAVGWANNNAPSTPTDTRSDTFTLAESDSVTVTPPTPALVQERYTSNCNNATCGLGFSNPVTAGNTLVFGLGWYGTFPYVPITVTNCQSPYTLGLDGDDYNSGTSRTLSTTITTAHTNDVIVAIVYGQNSGSGSGYRTPSLSDSSNLTWTARSSLEEESNAGGNSMFTQIFYAIASSTLSSDSVTVTWSSSPSLYGWIQVFGVSGANTSSPFDTNAALPYFATTGGYAQATTSNADDFIFGLENTASTSAPTIASGFSPLLSGVAASYTGGEYDIVTSTQSALTLSYSNAASDSDMAWADAIVGQTGCSSSSLLNIDGTAGSETETSSTTLTLTTQNSNDVIIVSAGTSSSTASVSSISDTAHHSWTKRTSEAGSSSVELEEWYTIAASPLSSDTITVTWTGSGDNTASAFGISGANVNAPFDTNGGLPDKSTGTTTTPSVSVSTSNANDFIFGLLANEHTSAATCHTETDGTGFSDVNEDECALGSSTSQNNDQEYEIVSSTQSGLSIPFTTSTGGSNSWAMIGDAVEAATGASTPATFQEMVQWDPNNYSSYEASNLGNIRFCTSNLCTTELYAWLESCSSSCSNTATLATAWVKLTSAISSGSTTTIYMVFESTNNTFDDNYWGEAPNLSGTYAQYDNGANVFTFYDDFSGSSLDANWQTIIYTGGTVTVNNGVTLSATSTTDNPMLVSKSTYTPAVLDASMDLTSEQTGSSTPSIFYATTLPATSGGDLGFKSDYRFDWYEPSSYYRVIQDVTGTNTGGSTVSASEPTGYNVWSATWSATGAESFAINYSPQVVTNLGGLTNGASYIGAAAVQGGSLSVQWMRLRALPPNGIMPTTTFGSLTSGNGAPASPTDTFSDTFTLASDNAVAVSNLDYYSYIWYGTASTSGSDTISVAFSSTVTGSVSIYELTGYTTVSPGTSTGYSTAGTSTPGVTSFTPASNSFVIGNVETSSSSSTYTAGSGFTLAGTCSSVYGCNEYEKGLGSATTVPSSLSVSSPWVEAAVSFAPQTTTTYYSYIWTTTAGSTGADTITANFGTTVAGSVSIYEVSGVTTSGDEVGDQSSSTPQSSASVSSITPSPGGSFVIGEAEATSTTFTAGSGYTLSGTCNPSAGCGEYESGVTSATTVPISFGTALPWVESAVALNPVATNYYSYIWYATASTSGADTVTTTFSQSTAASVSLYEISGYTTSGALSSTGSLQAGSTTASVTAFTPATDSFIVGQVEDASTTNTFTASSGFTLAGTASSVEGAGEYDAGGGGSSNTVPMTLSTSSPWVEAAMSFSTPFNPQSGIQVGGYPTMGVPSGASVVWEVTFTNVDPNQRAITIWPQTELAIGSAEYDGFDTDYTQAHYYIIQSLNAGSTTVNAYSVSGLITLQYDVPTILYFAATQALGSTTQAFGTNVLTPFQAYFALSGVFSDGTLFGETIPYPYGIITEANAYTTPTAGPPTTTTVTVSCTSPCYFSDSATAFVGWINSAGQVTTVKTFTTTSSGGIPSGVTFTVPNVANGYYTIEVTDYINAVFMTFQVT